MNKLSIRILSFFLAVVMLAGMVTVPGVAPEVSAAEFLGDQLIPSAETTYLNTGFDPNTYSDITLKNYSIAGNAADVRTDAGNYYAYLSRTSTSGNPPTLDYYTPSSVSDYIVISMDLATTTGKDVAVWLNGTSNRALHLYDANDGFGSRIRWSQNEVKDSNNNRLSTDLSGEYVNYTMVLDSVNSKFALWVDGQMVWSRTYDFGKVSRILVRAQGSGEDVKLDNLKVYSYDPNGTSATEPPTTESTTEPTTAPADSLAVYYNNDFSANADGITIADSSGNRSEYNEAGDYLYLRVHSNQQPTAAYWNKGEGNTGVLELPDQFVVSFDLAAIENWSAWQLRIVDENGNYIRILSANGGNRAFNYIYEGGAGQGYGITTTDGEIQYCPVTLLFDMTTGTYTIKTLGSSGTPIESADRTLRTSELAEGAAFGKVQYIQFESRGDNTSDGTTPRHIIIDNLKIYEGTEVLENVGPQNQFPEQDGPDSTEAPTEAVDVFYNNDFSANADGLTLPTYTSGENLSALRPNGDLFLSVRANQGAAAYWNKGEGNQGILNLPEKFVVTFDIASITTVSQWELDLVDEAGKTIRVLSGKDAGNNILYNDGTEDKSYYHGMTMSTDTETIYNAFTLVFDMTAGTYSYTYKNASGNGAKNDLKLRTPADFGEVQYIQFMSRADYKAGVTDGNIIIDNLKIYGGTEVLDTVGAQNVFPGQPGPGETPTEATTEATTEAPTEAPTGPATTEPIDPNVDVYYNNDFSANADGITIADSTGNKSEYNAAGDYLYLRVHSNRTPIAAYWNKGEGDKAAIELPEQFIVSFDAAAMNSFSSWELQLVDENGKTIRVLSYNTTHKVVNVLYDKGDGTGNHTPSLTATTEDALKYNAITLKFDMTAGTYDFSLVNGNGVNSNYDDLKLRSLAEFGKVQYIVFHSRGDDTSDGSTAPHLIIDNMKVYGGTTALNNVGPQNQFPPEPEPTEPEPTVYVDVYYNNDFSANTDGITLPVYTSGENLSALRPNGDLYLSVNANQGAAAYWNKGEGNQGILDLPENFVVTFDIAAVSLVSAWELALVDENSKAIRVLSGKNAGNNILYNDGTSDTSYYHGMTMSTDTETNYYAFTLAFDMTAGKYSYTFGDAAGKEDLKLRIPEGFGEVQYIRFMSRADFAAGKTGGNIIIDNLKIYSGTKVLANVGPQNQFPVQPDPDSTEPSATAPGGSDSEPVGPVDVYYNNDFSANTDGITLPVYTSGANNSALRPNGDLFLSVSANRGAAAVWNKGIGNQGILNLPEKFVVTFDIAAISHVSSWELDLVDENGKTIRVLSGKDAGNNILYRNDEGDKSYYHGMTMSTDTQTNYHAFTLVFDMAAGTYSYSFENKTTGGISEKNDLKLRLPEGFGEVQYINFQSRADYKTGVTDGNIIIDNLKIYSGTKVLSNVGPQNVFPVTEPEDTTPVDVYYNNDFSANTDGIVLPIYVSGKNNSALRTNGDLYLGVSANRGAAAVWNKGIGGKGLLDLPDQFVVTFDIASIAVVSQFEIRLVDENGKTIRVLSGKDAGMNVLYNNGTEDKSYYHGMALSTDSETKYHAVTLAFDMTTGKYSYTFTNSVGGVAGQNDLLLRGTEEFGEVQYIEFQSRSDYKTGVTDGNIIIDNLKIYSGTKVRNNVGSQNVFPSGSGSGEPGATAPIDPNVDVYYNNDFSANTDGIKIPTYTSGQNLSKRRTNGDLYLGVLANRGAAAYWNKGPDNMAEIKLPDKFIVTFDLAAIDIVSQWELNLVDENDKAIRVLSGKDAGMNVLYNDGTEDKSYYHGMLMSTDSDTFYHTVTLVLDLAAGKYSYTYVNNATGDMAGRTDLKLRTPEGFGEVQYIRFMSRADYKKDVTNGNIIIDNLKIYGGTVVQSNVGPQNKFPVEEEEDTTPVDVYYNNDFSQNANGIVMPGYSSGANNSKVKNGYLYLSVFNNRGVAAHWNKNLYGRAAIELPDQFIVSFDLAAVKLLSMWEMRLVDENGKSIRVVSGKAAGMNVLYNDGEKDNFFYHGLTMSTGGQMKYHTVTLAFDMAAGTYSYTFSNNNDSYAKKADLKLRGIADFGEVQYIEFMSRDDYVESAKSTGANIVIDNLKIYGGTKVRKNVGPQNVFPKTEDEDTGPVDVYYNNDFKNNADGITLYSASNSRSKHDAKNGYLYLNSHQYNGIVATWNMGKNGLGPIKMKDQFVITFDHAAIDKWSTWEMHLVDDKGNSVRLLANNGRDGGMKFLYDDGGYASVYPAVSTAKNIKYHPIALIIDMKTGTYAYETVDSYGNPVGKLDLKLRLPKNEKGESTFGTLRYIQFKSRGDDIGTENGNAVGGNLIIDNLKIYSGTKVRKTVGKQNTFQQPLEFVRPSAKPGNIRYINWKFEGNDKLNNDQVLMNGAEIRKESNGNGYVHLGYTSRFSFNYYGVWELTDYVVWQFSAKSKLNSTLQIEMRDTEDRAFHVISITKDTITPYYDKTLAKLKKGEWVDMAIAMNTVDKTYSVWYDGVLVAFNEKITKADFGTNGRIIFSIPSGDLKTAEAGIDNLRIYQGLCPDDFKNTIQAKEPPKDESYLDEMMGTQSLLLDYTEEELAIIKADGAIMVNTNTLFIYKDGKRIQGTKAEVDAILKNTAGKKVIKNGLGLVIICSNSLELTDDQIASLHDYMIYVRPSAKKLTSMLKAQGNEHPRVILTKDSLAQLRADYKNNELIKKIGNETIARAELLLKTRHIEFTDEGFTTTMNSRYQTLALAFLLTNDTRFKDYLWEDLEQTCKFPNWRTPTMLATSTGAFGVAVAYDWLYDEWTPAQRKVMEEGIYNNVLYHWHKQIYGKQTGAGTYISSTTNRNPVSNGGMGMACIAIMEVYPEKCADIMEKIYHMIEISLDDYAPSGATSEGPAYWQYTMDYYVPFLYTTINSFGTDFNLMKAPGFDTTADYILDVDGMTGVNNFHDSEGDGHFVTGEILGLANLLDRPDLVRVMRAKMDIYGPEKSIPTMLYLDTSIDYDGKVDKPLDGYYESMEIFMMRSSWSNSAGIFVSAHNGKTGISHDHLDSGSFVLDIGGQRFASDIGKESYDLKASQKLGYYYYRKRPEGHNVFVINPDLKEGADLGMNIGASDTVTKFVSDSRGAYGIMSLNSAYAGYAESAQRGIMLGDDRKSVLIRDEIRGMTKDTNEVWWFMQMEHVETKISKDGKSATLIKEGVEVHMQVLTDAKDYEIKVLPAKEMVPLEGLPDVDKQTPNTNFTRLAIVFKTGKDVNINVKFAEAGNPKGDTPIKDVALSKWSIPKGVLEAEPVLDGIEIGGVRIPDFVRTQTFYNFELPYGSEECPEVKTFGGDNCTIEIKKPKYLPDYLTITVTSNTDKANQTKYRIYLTVSGPIKVEVSDTPEPKNHAKNLLDGSLKTKWACSGAGWALFTFPSPQKVDAIWLCAMEMTLRVQPFDIEVSEDGVNFRQVWKGTTTMLPEGSKDQLQEFKIPEGEYKAIRINVTGARYPDGKEYSWSSIFEVMFYYQGKPIEIILQTSDPDSGFTENPNDTIEGGDNKDPNATEPVTEPEATQPSDVVVEPSGNNSGMVWLIVGLSAAAILVSGAIVVIIVLKKKKAAAGEVEEQPETPADSATE